MQKVQLTSILKGKITLWKGMFKIGALYLAALGWIYEDVVLSCQSLSRSQQHSPKSCHSTLQSISSQDKQADFFGSTISNEKTDIAIKWSVILSSFKVIFFGNLPYSNKYNTTWFVVRSNLFALELGFWIGFRSIKDTKDDGIDKHDIIEDASIESKVCIIVLAQQ